MKWGFALQSKEIQVDEDLPNFFKSVKLSQADELVIENDNMKDNFGICINDPDTINTLNETCIPKKAIQGTPWYQVLSNSKYSSMFYYIGAFTEEREKLIEDDQENVTDNDGNITEEAKKIRYEQSDMIMILLNLAYIPDSVVQKIHFKQGWHEDFKMLMDNYKEQFDAQDKSSNPDNQDLKWKFQDEDLETRYGKFKVQKEQKDELYLKAKKDYEDKLESIKKAALHHDSD